MRIKRSDQAAKKSFLKLGEKLSEAVIANNCEQQINAVFSKLSDAYKDHIQTGVDLMNTFLEFGFA